LIVDTLKRLMRKWNYLPWKKKWYRFERWGYAFNHGCQQ